MDANRVVKYIARFVLIELLIAIIACNIIFIHSTVNDIPFRWSWEFFFMLNTWIAGGIWAFFIVMVIAMFATDGINAFKEEE